MTDFSSIDRLVEFGIGVAVAQQMINTMNYAMGNMAVPGVGINPGVNPVANAVPPTPAEPTYTYYALIDDTQVGPLSDEELRKLINKEDIQAQSLVWRPGLTGWMFARDIPDVNRWFYLK